MIQTWQSVNTLTGHSAPVLGLAFSADGETIASSSIDGTIQLWNARTGKEGKTPIGHEDFVNGVAFSPDGHILASGSTDSETLGSEDRGGDPNPDGTF
ncbi:MULTISPECIES: WD40 repeat domain-containing protein [Planktothricoides]|uniref:Uncharacterized protein n=2 Tax=Planktothricoides raciborskii TaxID=132608 RepID=A0AAU8JCN7_9CYAN|nr:MULTISPECIES: hypothetical protein [Planktothricoides]MBD2544894.1 hypothetical protein [Planktothricoides raciborskii FACHB-1370]MBD2583011.1 hypothetical protein [Planktothricoides raciborskii FACHB-1261]